MQTIDDLEVAGRRVFVRADLNVPLAGVADHRRRPDPGRRPDHHRAGAARRQGDRRLPPRPSQGRAGRRSTRCAPVAERLCELLGKRGRVRDRHRGRQREGHRRRPGRRRGHAAGEPAVQRRARPPRTTPSAARSPTSWRRWPTLYVGDGFGAVHRKHASVYDLPARLPHAAGGLVAHRGRRAAQAHRRRRRGRTRSCSAAPRSPTSSASSTTCWAGPTGSWSAAAWCYTFLKAAGPRGRQQPARRRTRSDRSRSYLRPRRGERRGVRAAGRRRRLGRVFPT